MKFRITKDSTIHRGKACKAGDIVEENDRNHAGGLQCAGAVPVKDGESVPVVPAKKAAPKKKAAKPAAVAEKD